MTYVKINDTLYPAEIAGRMNDTEWDGRESKSITLEMSHADALEIFVDGAEWSIVQTYDTPDGQDTPPADEWDNSECCVAGDITDHRDGTVTVKMGKYTDLESMILMMV